MNARAAETLQDEAGDTDAGIAQGGGRRESAGRHALRLRRFGAGRCSAAVGAVPTWVGQLLPAGRAQALPSLRGDAAPAQKTVPGLNSTPRFTHAATLPSCVDAAIPSPLP